MVSAALHWATSIKTRIDWSAVCHWSWLSSIAMRLVVLYERRKRLESARAAVWMNGMTARGTEGVAQSKLTPRLRTWIGCHFGSPSGDHPAEDVAVDVYGSVESPRQQVADGRLPRRRDVRDENHDMPFDQRHGFRL